LAQLEERPGMPLIAMFVANRYPLSDSAQVFESECLARYDGLLDELLTDAVIGVLLEAGFALAYAADTALGTARVDFLQALATQVITAAEDVDHCTGEVPAFAVSGELGDSQINAQRAAARFGLSRRFPALGDVQVVGTAAPDEIGSADLPLQFNKHSMLASAKDKTAIDTALKGVERHAVQAHQPIGACVVADAAPRAKNGAGVTLLRLDGPDRFDRFGPGTDRQLGAQAELRTGLAIDAVMRRGGVGDGLVPAHTRDPCRCRVEGALGCGQYHIMAVHIELAADGAGEGCFQV